LASKWTEAKAVVGRELPWPISHSLEGQYNYVYELLSWLTRDRLIGLLYNNQQYSIKNLKFKNVATAIAVQHAFVITLQGIECENVGICVDMSAIDVTGSMSLIDSSCDV
jgi:hypothetical protein